ncbi:uncharacterized protein LOC121393210 [Xenopus laevis]|uniref:Uncharacterized protein LOC121393210 n=1 Tax=Xenopus laevis TaxID=8355 RepID=A0A8J1KJY3_XENLA|nr:uncharacterized protein LOC121393210 [Xenopus laevis]
MKLIATEVKYAVDDGIINDIQAQFLINRHPITPVLYTLPKVHKNPTNPPGRPIVAGTDSVLQPLAVFLDTFLQPLAQAGQSYLRDTTHLLNKLREIQMPDNNFILATLDVQSLYTSIPHEEGIQTCRERLEQDNLEPRLIEFLVTLLQIVLTRNYFRYGSLFYEQIQGTAMGANMAPSYANIFMTAFEKQYVDIQHTFFDYIHWWCRYIDDCFMIWTGSEKQLIDFVEYLNTCHTTIKFTCTSSLDTVEFLDVRIYKGEGRVETDLYQKPMATNSYLHAASFHPRSQLI